MVESFLAQYLKILQEMGITPFDLTPYCQEDKSLEIKAYLRSNPQVVDFVIIDDEPVCLDLLKYQVLPDLYKGLSLEHIKPILAILNGKLGFYPPNYDLTENSEQRLIRINKYYNQGKRK